MDNVTRTLHSLKDIFARTSVAAEVSRLADRPILPALAPKRPWDISLVTMLKAASPAAILTPQAVVNPESAAAVKSGLLLWADGLVASHEVAQEHEDHDTCSYWHAIMHRREPDFSNSKYWYQRTSGHPIHARLRNGALQVLRASARADVVTYMTDVDADDNWEAERFVDSCERAAKPGADAEFVRCLEQIQVLEIALLLEHSYREAVGDIA